jgi:hypothetical protein
VLTAPKLAAAKAMIDAGQHTMTEIAEAVGCGRATLYRELERARTG